MVYIYFQKWNNTDASDTKDRQTANRPCERFQWWSIDASTDVYMYGGRVAGWRSRTRHSSDLGRSCMVRHAGRRHGASHRGHHWWTWTVIGRRTGSVVHRVNGTRWWWWATVKNERRRYYSSTHLDLHQHQQQQQTLASVATYLRFAQGARGHPSGIHLKHFVHW